MDDKDKVELTVGDVRRAAEKCGTAKEVLKEMFPQVFKTKDDGWERMNSDQLILSTSSGMVEICMKDGGWYMFRSISGEGGFFKVGFGDSHWEWKMENGSIWRKKS